MSIEIILNGSAKTVTKEELFDLAARGEINPDTPINVNGTLTTAGKAKGIVFGRFQTPGQPAFASPFTVSPAPRGFSPLPPQQPMNLEQEWEQARQNEFLQRQNAGTPVSDPALQWIVPLETSFWAVLAGYAGLLSPFCFLAPLALILGIVALYDIRKRNVVGKGRAIFAIVMGGLFTIPLIVFLIMSLVAFVSGGW